MMFDVSKIAGVIHGATVLLLAVGLEGSTLVSHIAQHYTTVDG